MGARATRPITLGKRFRRHLHTVTESSYERHVRGVLEKKGLPYIQEYSFPALPTRRYDFLIPNENLLIEVDGEQHFKYIKYLQRRPARFKQTQQADILKTRIAEEFRYGLLRIDHNSLEETERLIDLALAAPSTLFLSNPVKYTWLDQPLKDRFQKELDRAIHRLDPHRYEH